VQIDTGYPDPESQAPFGRKNLGNALLAFSVPIPAVACAAWLYHWFPAGRIPPSLPWADVSDADQFAAYLLGHPIIAANVFYFVFVDLAFYAISLVQRSSWLIDLFWTLLPVLLAGFYFAHPFAVSNPLRVVLAGTPLLIWSLRLTGNYFRRESWRFGLREDWRYAKMRADRPHFWFEQFFVVQLAQHGMLIGLSLPFYSVAFHSDAVGGWDYLACAGALLGIAVAGTADNQLDRFMRGNEARVRRGEPPIVLLETGIWRYSRHPNYFGEQLFWWSTAVFGIALGQPWVAIGTAYNSCVLAGVTIMTERRMLAVPRRAAAYAEYRRRTSVWLPWPPKHPERRNRTAS